MLGLVSIVMSEPEEGDGAEDPRSRKRQQSGPQGQLLSAGEEMNPR